MPNLLWKYAPICGTCLVCVDECVYVCVIWLWLYLFITHDITQLVALCDFMEVSFQASVSTSMWEGRRFAVTCQWVFKAESTINQVYGADEGELPSTFVLGRWYFILTIHHICSFFKVITSCWCPDVSGLLLFPLFAAVILHLSFKVGWRVARTN